MSSSSTLGPEAKSLRRSSASSSENASAALGSVLMQGVLALAAEEALLHLLDAQSALHGQAQDRGGETPVVVAHVREVAHRGGRLPLRRLVVGHDDAPGRISSDRTPRAQVIEHQEPEPAGREERGPGVAEQVAGAAPRIRWRHVALGPARHDGEPFARRECPRRSVGCDAGIDPRGPFASLRTLRTGVRLHGDRFRRHGTR